MNMLNRVNKIHFVGIGGIGMSGLARILFDLGYKISGSDKVDNFCINKLRERGIEVFVGHKKDNLKKEVGLVVYSSSIPQDNPELEKARSERIPIVHRSEILSFLMQSKIGIAIAGAHGKTTITGLIAHILKEAGLEATAVVGGWLKQYDTNAWLGKGDFFVAESDESDGSFLKLSPFYSVVNNIDFEHVDYYRNMKNIVEAYRKFIEKTRQVGCVFYCYDDFYLKEIMKGLNLRSISYGFDTHSDIYPENISLNADGVEFDCIYFGKKVGRFRLQIPGRHNILNAQVAIALSRELNIEWEKIKKALYSYQGTRRRFEIRKSEPIMIVDDYAHHPNEIKVTLETAQTFKKKRIIVVFQPHRYTRTFYLREKFVDAFYLADKLMITDIYSADEEPIEGVNGFMLCEEILKKNKEKDILFLSKKEIVSHLLEIAKKDDLILMIGAGDITKITDELLERFDEKC